MIQAFAFDLDETLVDCEPQHRHATRIMLEAMGHTTEGIRDVFHDLTGARTSDILEAYRAKLGASQSVDEMLTLRHTAYLAALDDEPARPLPGVPALLAACKARGPLALVTSGHRDDVLESLRSAGLMAMFDVFVVGEDVVLPKPAPEPYLLAAKRLGYPPSDVLVFEDSVRGVTSAREAGCPVVAVPNARSTTADAVKDANVVLASMEDALPLGRLLERLP